MNFIKVNSLLFLPFYILASCGNSTPGTSNNNDSTINTNNMTLIENLRETRNYGDSTNYSRVPLLTNRLSKNGYNFPSQLEFRTAILNIFNIDIDTSKIDDIPTEYNYNPYGYGGGFIILKKDKFIVYNALDTYLDTLKKFTPTREKDFFFN